MYEIKLEQFSGPYDLLVQLIESRDLDITKISLSEVTQQFLDYVDGFESVEGEELADFLIVASRLLWLKSKSLLPTISDEEDYDNLENHLKIYKIYLDASKQISAQIEAGRTSYGRERAVVLITPEFRMPKGCSQELMSTIMHRVISKLEPLIKLPKALLERTVTLQERIRDIRRLIGSQREVAFSDLLKISESRLDMIVSFLALLELVNKKQVRWRQDSHFDEIIIST